MKKTAVLILLFSVLLSASDWIFVKRTEGVSVYKRPSVLYPIDEVLVVGMVDSKLPMVVRAVKDIDRMSKYYKEMEKMYLVEKIDENNYYTYSLTGMPWPLKNRETIMKVNLRKDGNKVIVTSVAQKYHPKVPINNDNVRITRMFQQWVLIDCNDKTKVSQVLKIDPSGNIPKSVMNTILKTVTIDSIKNLRRMVEDY